MKTVKCTSYRSTFAIGYLFAAEAVPCPECGKPLRDLTRDEQRAEVYRELEIEKP